MGSNDQVMEEAMKSKKFHRRLVLNKTTVADLNRGRMSRIYGGETEGTCPFGTCTECQSVCLNKCPLTDPGGTGATCLMSVIKGCE